MKNINKDTIRELKKGYELEYSSALLFLIMMSSNVLNYVFQILMGHYLAVEEYGTLTALLSMIAIVSVIPTIFTMLTARYTVMLSANDQSQQIRELFQKMSLIIVGFAGILMLLSIFCSGVISEIFKINNKNLIVLTFLVIAVSTFYSVSLGVLQGLKRFFHYGFTGFLATLGKLVFSIIFVVVGFKLFGVIAGILLGIVFATGYAVFHIRDVLREKNQNCVDKLKLNGFQRYLSTVLLAQIFISIITNGDILLVKYFFSSAEAGYYSSAMVLAKISMYVAAAIVAALFPIAAENQEKGGKVEKLLQKSLLYGGGIAILCATGLTLFSGIIIKIMYGVQYSAAAQYILPISVFIIPVTFFMILMNYQLAVNNAKPLVGSLFAGIILSGISITLFHSSIPQLLYGISSCLVIGIMIDFILISFGNKHTAKY